MDNELITEKIAHLETRRTLWQAQQQLLNLLYAQSEAELAALRVQLAQDSGEKLHVV